MIKSMLQVFACDVLAKLMLAVVILALIRVMSPTEYAAYTLMASLSAIFSQTLATAFNRIYIIGHGSGRLDIGPKGSFLAVQLAVVSSLTLAAALAASRKAGLAAAAGLLAAGWVLSDFLKTDYQNAKHFARFSVVELARSALILIALLAWLAVSRGAIASAQALGLQGAALALIAIPLLLRRGLFAGLTHFRNGLAVVRAIATSRYRLLLAYFAVLTVLSQADVWMVKLLGSDAMLAAYGSAFRYYSLLLLSLGAVHTVLLPTLRDIATRTEAARIFARHWRLVLIFTPCVLGGLALAPRIIPLLDNGKYPESIPVFQVLAASSILSFALSPHVNLIMRNECFTFLFVTTLAATASAVAFHLFLIPRFGAVGAAVATFLAFGIVNTLTWVQSRRLLKAMPA